MPDIIDLTAERDKRTGPDAQFVRLDHLGRKMFAFCLDYRMDDAYWTASIWAYDFEDAERRVSAIRDSLKLAGQIYAEVPG